MGKKNVFVKSSYSSSDHLELKLSDCNFTPFFKRRINLSSAKQRLDLERELDAYGYPIRFVKGGRKVNGKKFVSDEWW